MNIVDVNRSAAYNAPGHFDMRSIRLHNPYNGCEAFTVSMSHILPGGGTDYLVTPCELVYFMLQGEMTIMDKEGEEIAVLKPNDSVHFAPGDGKQMLNKSNYSATVLVITGPMPNKH